MQKDGNERGRERKEVKGNDVEVIEKEETARGRKGGDGRKWSERGESKEKEDSKGEDSEIQTEEGVRKTGTALWAISIHHLHYYISRIEMHIVCRFFLEVENNWLILQFWNQNILFSFWFPKNYCVTGYHVVWVKTSMLRYVGHVT